MPSKRRRRSTRPTRAGEAAFERERRGAATPGLDRASGPTAGPMGPIDPVDDAGAAAGALELASVRELAWAFRRCSSRLAEMLSPDWPVRTGAVGMRAS